MSDWALRQIQKEVAEAKSMLSDEEGTLCGLKKALAFERAHSTRLLQQNEIQRTLLAHKNEIIACMQANLHEQELELQRLSSFEERIRNMENEHATLLMRVRAIVDECFEDGAPAKRQRPSPLIE
jgi:hypothetical protein